MSHAGEVWYVRGRPMDLGHPLTQSLLAALGLALVTALRYITTDAQLRRDLGGSAWFLGGFLVTRGLSVGLAGGLPEFLERSLTVVWVLLAAFAVIRAVVALLLLFARRVLNKNTTKITRDVLDFVFYVLVAVPVVKTQLAIDLTSLLATSAILSVVLGLALQDTLGNLFAGLSLQLERPYAVGDFIRVGTREGRVIQIAWRSTKIETMRRETITLPNSLLAKEAVMNHTNGGQPAGIEVFFGASYAAPPNLVRAEVLAALDDAPLVLSSPPPVVRAVGFDESSARYMVRFFISDFGEQTAAEDELFTRLWYRFGRAGIEIPFPHRVLHFGAQEKQAPASFEALINTIDLFMPFSAEERRSVLGRAIERRFGAGERIITEGDEGHTFYIVAAGRVSVRLGHPPRPIAELGVGNAFGEMSLLTGERRSATVTAIDDVLLLEFDRDAFTTHFENNSELARRLADVLATRKAELAELQAGAAHSGRDAGSILLRLRSIFRLPA